MSARAAGVAARARWYFNRLRCMTPVELGHRLLRELAIRAPRRKPAARNRMPVPDPAAASPAWIRPPAGVDAVLYLEAGARIAEGRFDLFALEDATLGSPPQWNRDPKTGTEAPLGDGRRLDYRDERLVGDIKYLWELNRHTHLVTLSQAWALGGGERYAEALRRHLESWFAACPFPAGPNWASALEAAIRLINWSATWQLIGGAASPLFGGGRDAALRARWLESVYEHARFVRANFSRDSSANNHLIGEAAGLFIGALTWPCWAEARDWRDEAHAILEHEAVAQSFADGVNREQAVCYQRFVLELLMLSMLAGSASGVGFSPRFRLRVEAMLEYLASIMDAGGNVPMLGDGDDGRVLELAQMDEPARYRSLLACGALLFRRADLARKAGWLDAHTRWLFDESAARKFAARDGVRWQLPVRRVFGEGGMYLLGCDLETENEVRLTADAGPLGFLGIAAHGHADALSFTLSVGGLEFLVDPGTYAYHANSDWRQYFRGTGAHNTVRVDGQDQSTWGGNFMWLGKARASGRAWTGAEVEQFEGWHDGYLRLRDPVLHGRRISLDTRTRRVLIEDALEMSGQHEIELFLHCCEDCRVEALADGYALRRGARTLVIRLPLAQGAQWRLHVGSVAPICGWVSRGLDRKRPAPTIAWHARLAGPALLQTEILC